jgi:hypothetical protein
VARWQLQQPRERLAVVVVLVAKADPPRGSRPITLMRIRKASLLGTRKHRRKARSGQRHRQPAIGSRARLPERTSQAARSASVSERPWRSFLSMRASASSSR